MKITRTIHRNKRELDTRWTFSIDRAADAGVAEVSFTGGKIMAGTGLLTRKDLNELGELIYECLQDWR